jgi:ribonucleoside-diphosphate reductase alpha chain
MTETTSDTQSGSTRSGSRATQRGLTIERVYTTPGVHPYDEVTWERRDVVMTNWRDGTINFEQRGVEFPDSWSVNAANIVTTKYFRGAVDTEQREWSLKQLIDRVVLTYVKAGQVNGYFGTVDDATIFEHELTYALLHQVFSFNSPVWFNVGTSAPQQVSACFILAVDDKMESILDWYKEEGMIFKGGSGSGVNLSRIRSSKELLSSGGTASGPVSFMRGADASAGTIKSGGATRRAAKMVILDVDHPDIEEFIETKAREEDKIRVLRDAGYDMDLGGRDMSSVQYQNANNSVRVTEEFMRAFENGTPFGLKGRMDGSVIETVDAKTLMRKMAQAAWECADPGIQYDDTINDWHTTPESGRITASNPCFPADQRVVTDKGLVRIGELVARAAAGEDFAVYTNDVTAEHDSAPRVVATKPERYIVSGTNEILELRFSDGSRLRCTPGHGLWTSNRGWVHAEDIQADDRVVRSFHEAMRPMASLRLPASAVEVAQRASALNLPQKWDADFAHFLGWLVGDGCLTDDTLTTVYGSDDDKTAVLPRHQGFLAGWTGFDVKPSVQANGALQLRSGKSEVVNFFEAMGITQSRAKDKVVPEAIFEAPHEALVSFLQGLFDADGCVVDQLEKGTRYVGLGSRSEELLLGVQELLASLGVASRIYKQATKKDSFHYVRKDSSEVTYPSDGPSFDLRISGRSMRDFAALVSFSVPAKLQRLAQVVDYHSVYNVDEAVTMVSREARGFEMTYNLTEPRNHSYIVSGVVVANCSEYMHLDNSSCNLASLNLMKFLKDDDTFDAVTFAKVVEFIITAMDISICFADFPTEKIGDTTRKFRQLGIGYANLGALLMATGHAYDSDSGRALAAGITSLMTGTAYKRSAELAAIVGPYEGYARNAEAHRRVMRKHAAASDAVRSVGTIDHEVIRLANKAWQDGLKIGEKNGWRNAQASVLAPTGCLTGDTMVSTSRGLTRLSELGNVYGDRWQDVEFEVSTDEGPQEATKFFVNGEEPTRRIVTVGGYRVQGTLAHRVKIVDSTTGEWVWKRLADVVEGDIVPMQLGSLVGEPRRVVLPVIDQAYYPGDRDLCVPDAVDADLAELVGYFMGDGSLHAKGIRLCVADTDLDVVDRMRVLSKGLFGLEPVVTQQQGYHEVTLQSVRLARWWQAAGFAKTLPTDDHVGKGWTPRVPSALLETNDVNVYTAFVRGLFEADGTVLSGVPSVSTSSESFAAEIRTMLLAVGLPTTTRETVSGFGGPIFQVRLRNLYDAGRLTEGSLVGQRPKAPGYIFEQVAANDDGGVQPTYDLSVPSNVTYVAAGFVSHNTIGLMMDCDTTGIEPDLALVKFKKLVGGGSMQIVNQTVPRALRQLGYQEEQVEAIVEHIAEHGKVVNAPGLRPEHYEVFDCAMGERSISALGHVRMMAAVQPFISGAISKTVNLPETATVEDVEEVYYEGWKLGLKALAIYRNNCKVGQPLSDAREKKAAVAAPTEYKPVRKRLPKRRPSQTVSFAVAGAEGYLTAGSYPDDGLGEVFLKLGKQGSTLAGVMDAFSIAISIALQYGVPLEAFVSKFVNMRFDPAGLTDDPDVRMAQSIMDYIFRRLALDYLSYEQRAEFGIFTADERAQTVAAKYGDDTSAPVIDDELEYVNSISQSAPIQKHSTSELPEVASAKPVDADVHSSTELLERQLGTVADAPLCMGCGTKMRPAGSCYVCEGCGSTSGCS